MRDSGRPMSYALGRWFSRGVSVSRALASSHYVSHPRYCPQRHSGCGTAHPLHRCTAPRAAVTSAGQAKAGWEMEPLDPSGKQTHTARRGLVPWNMVEHLPWLHLQHLAHGFQHAQVQQRVLVIGQLADGVDVQPGLAHPLPSTHPTFVS